MSILSLSEAEQNDHILETLLARATAAEPPTDDATVLVEGIVFSKDRPMQLAATLGSFLDLVRGDYILHVLYTSSSKAFSKAYDELRTEIPSPRIHWHRETHFKPDLLGVLDRVRTKQLFFLVDDLIVTRTIDLEAFCCENPSAYVPSLRLGPNLQRCYTADSRQALPRFTPAENDLLTWSWREAEWDWSYALSVDGHILPTAEVRTMAAILDYKAPNTFEGALQAFAGVYSRRPGLCAQHSCLVNIPHNRVQNENANRSQGLSADQLLDSWNSGDRIDHKALREFDNVSAHQEVPLPLHRPQSARNTLTDA